MRDDLRPIMATLKQLLAERGMPVRVFAGRASHATLMDAHATRHIASITLLGDGRLRVRFGSFDVTTDRIHTHCLPDVADALCAGSPHHNRSAFHRVRNLEQNHA
jgi:hypothetical protein